MKTLLLLSFVTFTASAFSYSEFESWKKVSTKTEKARGGKQFKALMEKYPEVFPFGNVKKVVSASVTFVTWKYVGTHTCAPEDARLIYTGRGMSYCDKQGAATVCGSSVAQPPMGDYDPCQWGFEEETQY